nr:hypothetical protein [Flavobacterium cheongpyeongense]
MAIGSSQNFKLETCVQLKLSFAIASFQADASLSNETPMIFNPFECSSLYMATTLGFSFLHGPHHEAQKSTIVTFPKLSLSDILLPSGLGAEKSDLHLALPTGGADAPTAGNFI